MVSSGVIQQQALAQCSVVVNEDGVVERVKQLSGLQSDGDFQKIGRELLYHHLFIFTDPVV